MVKSLLGALIAAQQEKNHVKPHSSTQDVVQPTKKRRRTTSHLKRHNSDNNHNDDRKPAAKRKRQVYFETDEEDEDDDENDNNNNHSNHNNHDHSDDEDSLYRDDLIIPEESTPFDENEDDDDDNPNAEFQDHFTKAFQVLYGPSSRAPSALAPNAHEYFETIQETMVPKIPPIKQYAIPSERSKPRLKKVKNPSTKTWMNIEETTLEAQQRVYRQQRVVERSAITFRWKRRVLDLRNEPDVGGAIYKRAKRQLQDKVRKELREQREQKELAKKQREEELVRAKEQKEHMARNDDEDSMQEQQNVLDRLTQQSGDDNDYDQSTATIASTNDTSADETMDGWTDHSVAYKERLDYWNNGYTYPRDVEFPVNIPDLRPHLSQGQTLQDPDPKGLRLPGRPNFQREKEFQDWKPSYFPPSKASRNPRFFQYRLLQALVARHLCGGGTDEKLQQRLLRLLFSPTHFEGQSLAKFTTARTFLKLSHQLGCNALLYATNTWSDPAAVARELGLLGQETLAGRIQNPGTIQVHMTFARQQVCRKYRLQETPWIHHSQRETKLRSSIMDLPVVPTVTNTETINKCRTVSKSKETDDDTKKKRAAQMDVETFGSLEASSVAIVESPLSAKEINVQNPEEPQSADTSVLSCFQNHVMEKDRFGSVMDISNIGIMNQMKKENDNIPSQDERQSVASQVESATVNQGNSEGGVIVDLATKSSEPSQTSSNWNERTMEQFAPQEAMLFPTSTFSHIPGTSPPVPPFPLDPTGIVYGPMDRCAKYDHQDNHIHHGHFQLALATLLSRVLRSDHERHRQQIQTLLEQYVEITDNKAYKRHFIQSQGKINDVPLVQFYRALRCYCSFWANGYPSLSSIQEPTFETDDYNTIKDDMDDNNFYTETKSCVLNQREVAEQLFEFLERRISHNGLVRFPRLKVTFALTTITRKLPVAAAKIISRPLEEHECPIHIMRQSIEFLEACSLIRGGQETGYMDVEDESIRHGELEYIFFEAAEIFQSCVQADAMNIEYHAWRVATLAVCFLLCSGNRIDSSARRYPSAYTHQVVVERMKRNERDSSSLEHEVREKLPKYEEVATQLTSAIHVMFSLVQCQPGAKAHLTVASLLEWKQVIALLASDTLDRCLSQIATLYNHHAYHRYLQEYSESARHAVVNSSKSVNFYATELENDPSNIECWRALVNALGPIGRQNPSTGGDNHRDHCSHCQLLRQERIIDHQQEKGLGSNWWSHGRQWWLTSLLHIPNDSNQRRNQSTAEPVLCKLEYLAEDIIDNQESPTSIPVNTDYGNMMNWLPTRQRLRERRAQNQPCKEERDVAFDEKLPPFSNQNVSINATSTLRGLAGSVSPKVEVLCYKIFIFCHMIGPGDPWVYDRIYFFVRDCWDNKIEQIKDASDSFQVLDWLYDAGIDIPAMCRRKYPKYMRQPLKKQHVPKGKDANKKD